MSAGEWAQVGVAMNGQQEAEAGPLPAALDGEYRLVARAGKIEELVLVQPGNPDVDEDQNVSMETVAEMLHRSYCWVSRNWRLIGLHPAKFGRPYLFSRDEVRTRIEEHRTSLRGRPRKPRPRKPRLPEATS